MRFQSSEDESSSSSDENKKAVYHSIETGRSSPAMEAEGASVLWNRSIELHNMRYKWMVDIAVYAMKKNIIAILHHCVNSTDNAKQHRFCPPGDSSWCKWQQDQATGTSTYKGDDCLPEVFVETLKPTFVSLSDSKLLERCVRGKTQNPNESINAMVWVRVPNINTME
ncbi:unnamed protein product [Pocillopora meandrina]|uniref:Uncharacterized protein n=1 Tax=Pocillopora meandrina TaxID=46732 RepID=A0AAU9VN38_9CNID|nr:unnamed protein product [Pocillopora meandrina]